MLSDFKPVLKILLRFVLIYVVLLLMYQLYLNTQHGALDSVSTWVAGQVVHVQEALGFSSALVPVPGAETTCFRVNGAIPSRMAEGCNAVSIMILFVAFIFAFYKGRKTFIFAIIGLIILHIMNVLHIAGLNLLYFKGAEYFKMGHDYLFPAAIYGTVVALWLIWIKFFALKDEVA